VGTNSRLDALQVAVLRVKLPHLRGWTEARRKNACYYHGALTGVDGITVPETLPGNYHVYNQYTVRVERRDELRAHLQEQGIGSGVYYPVPLHLQECFSEMGGREGQLPEAEAACREVLSLPIFPELGEERMEQVALAIRAFFGAR
jgi:dTDP-4-amino-4,6-dideoxygalactose transaminase